MKPIGGHSLSISTYSSSSKTNTAIFFQEKNGSLALWDCLDRHAPCQIIQLPLCDVNLLKNVNSGKEWKLADGDLIKMCLIIVHGSMF